MSLFLSRGCIQRTATTLAANALPLPIGREQTASAAAIETPVLDALAKEGGRLTAHYSPSPLCSPARAGYLTGRFNHPTGAIDVPSNRGLNRIDLSKQTFGDYFRHAGYATVLIGKRYKGLYCRDLLPHRRGFDQIYGFPLGGQDYLKWNLLRKDDTAHLPPRDPAVLARCISPATLGQLRVQTAQLPTHRVAEQIELWPMVQPMAQL